jgi:hypothetical protein
MKKIYFSLALFFFTFQLSKAQLSLTKTFNEPVVGDIYNKMHVDSITAVPKTTGANQLWNFSAMTATNSFIETSTYTTVASTPSPGVFPAATVAEKTGTNSITMFKATTSSFEFQGLQFPGSNTAINFTNTGVFANWPVAFGYNNPDTFGGSQTSGTVTSSLDGFINVEAPGTGTVVLPGGVTLSNCLQVIVSLTVNMNIAGSTQTMVSKEYTYYHASNKFPVMSVQYQTTTQGTVTTKDFFAAANTAIANGLSKHDLQNSLAVFPNPASDDVTLSLDNSSNDNVSVSLTNLIGQKVKEQNLGNHSAIRSNLELSDLPNGVYMLTVKVGSTSAVKKLIVQ